MTRVEEYLRERCLCALYLTKTDRGLDGVADISVAGQLVCKITRFSYDGDRDDLLVMLRRACDDWINEWQARQATLGEIAAGGQESGMSMPTTIVATTAAKYAKVSFRREFLSS